MRQVSCSSTSMVQPSIAVPLLQPCLSPGTWVELSNHFPHTNQKLSNDS